MILHFVHVFLLVNLVLVLVNLVFSISSCFLVLVLFYLVFVGVLLMSGNAVNLIPRPVSILLSSLD